MTNKEWESQLKNDIEPTPTRIEIKGDEAVCTVPFITEGNIQIGSFLLAFTRKQ